MKGQWMVQRGRRAHGMVLIYTTVAATVLLGFCSLAVDLGRVQTAKTELERVAAAAARAAVAGLSTSVTQAQNNAAAIGAANTVDGTPVTIDVNNDIQFGTWNTLTRQFTVLTGAARSGANAVQVTCGRTAAKGNQVPLLFAGPLGRTGCNVNGVSTALIVNGWAAVGLNSVTLGGSAYTDSYNSNNGAYNSSHVDKFASVASNGPITVGNTAVVKGDARPGAGQSVTLNQSGSVVGNKAPLASAVGEPAASVPGGVTDLGDVSVSSGAYNLPGGTYQVGACDLSGMPCSTSPGPSSCT